MSKILVTSKKINKLINNLEHSSKQSKQWRKSQKWYKNGKSNECELYQKKQIELVINKKISKSNKRFNFEKNIFIDCCKPNLKEDGFEYTENVDGYIKIKNIDFYFNFKMVCDKGGSQIRTLKEVYHYIKAQLEWLNENSDKKIIFINILDGDESHRNRNKFNYLINSKKYADIINKIFIGDSKEFCMWFYNKFNK
jgi:hypothetical protein